MRATPRVRQGFAAFIFPPGALNLHAGAIHLAARAVSPHRSAVPGAPERSVSGSVPLRSSANLRSPLCRPIVVTSEVGSNEHFPKGQSVPNVAHGALDPPGGRSFLCLCLCELYHESPTESRDPLLCRGRRVRPAG